MSYTLIVDRIEAWGEEYDQPLASGYTHTATLASTEGESGRTRKVSKVKLNLDIFERFSLWMYSRWTLSLHLKSKKAKGFEKHPRFEVKDKTHLIDIQLGFIIKVDFEASSERHENQRIRKTSKV